MKCDHCEKEAIGEQRMSGGITEYVCLDHAWPKLRIDMNPGDIIEIPGCYMKKF